ncbi:uncharacterized protein UDID_17525 [Ustilago sp. UG-2017a]|nr:uncharacterized protein UDID_17525 [Ustilago sp. UG-2017a]
MCLCSVAGDTAPAPPEKCINLLDTAPFLLGSVAIFQPLPLNPPDLVDTPIVLLPAHAVAPIVILPLHAVTPLSVFRNTCFSILMYLSHF